MRLTVAFVVVLALLAPTPAAAQGAQPSALDLESRPYAALLGAALGNILRVDRQPSPGDGVWSAHIQIAGATVPVLGYHTAPGGPTSNGTEGFYVYVPLGTLKLATVVPAAAELGAFGQAATTMYLVLSDSNNRRIPFDVLPRPIQSFMNAVYNGTGAVLPLGQGANFVGNFELALVPGVGRAFQLFQFGPTRRPFSAQIPGGAAAALLRGQPPAPGPPIRLVSPLPPPHLPPPDVLTQVLHFNPGWNATITLAAGATNVALDGPFDGGLPAVAGGSPAFSLPFHGIIGGGTDGRVQLLGTYLGNATSFLGLGWLAVQNPTFGVEFPATGSPVLDIAGTLQLGGKSFVVGVGQAMTDASSVPTAFRFVTKDDLSLADLARLTNALANGASPPKIDTPIPVTQLPDLAIRHPTIIYSKIANPKIGLPSPGYLVTGTLSVLQQSIADVTARAAIGGISLKASVTGGPSLRLGPVTLPSGNIALDLEIPTFAVAGGAKPHLDVTATSTGSTYSVYDDSVAWQQQLSLVGGAFAGTATITAPLHGGAAHASLTIDDKGALRRFSVNIGAGLKFLASAAQSGFTNATNAMHRYTEDLRQAELGVLAMIEDQRKVEAQAGAVLNRAQGVVNDLEHRRNSVCGSIHWYNAAWKGPECAVLSAAVLPAQAALAVAQGTYNQIVSAAEKTIGVALAHANTLIQNAANGLDGALRDFDAVMAQGTQPLVVAAAMAGKTLDDLSQIFQVTRATVTADWPINPAQQASVNFSYVLLGSPGTLSARFGMNNSFPDLFAAAGSGGAGPVDATYDPTGKSLPPHIQAVAAPILATHPSGPLDADAVARLKDTGFCASYPREEIAALRYAEANRADGERLLKSTDRNVRYEGVYVLLAADALERNVIVQQYGAAAAIAWQDLVQAPLSVCDPGFTPADAQRARTAREHAARRQVSLQDVMNALAVQPAVPTTGMVAVLPFGGVAAHGAIPNTPRGWEGRPQTGCVDVPSGGSMACATARELRLQIVPTVAADATVSHPSFRLQTSDGRCWTRQGTGLDLVACAGGNLLQLFNFVAGNIVVADDADVCLTLDANDRFAFLSGKAACRATVRSFFAIVDLTKLPVAVPAYACLAMTPPPVARTSFAGMPVVPLYRYYAPDPDRHYFATDWSEQAGCGFEGIVGYVFNVADEKTAAANGFGPLYRYRQGTDGSNFIYTTDWDELREGQSDFNYIGNLGYVSSYYRPGLTQLVRYHRPARQEYDNLVSTDFTDPAAQAAATQPKSIAGWILAPEDLAVQPATSQIDCKLRNPTPDPRHDSIVPEPIVGPGGGLAVPLFRYYVADRSANYYTLDWREYGACLNYGHEGYLLVNPAQGTVPIYRFINAGNRDALLTPNRNGAAGFPHIFDRVLGYGYADQGPGRVALDRYRLNDGSHLHTVHGVEPGPWTPEGMIFYLLDR